MKLRADEIGSFLSVPRATVLAALLYGPDEGLARERADALLRGAGADPRDPFRFIELPADALRKDPARLSDEARAVAFGGGRRVIRVREAGDGLSRAFEGPLDDPGATALVIVEGGDLPARSALRRLFEGHARAVTIPCYADEARDLTGLVRDTLAAANLKADADVVAFLAASLGNDRMVTRRELEKLVLYMGGPGTVTLDDARACVGDSAALSLDDVVQAAAGGDVRAADRALARAWSEDLSAVAVVRATIGHFTRLHLAAGMVAAGAAPEAAIGALRPPVFFKQRDAFRRQLALWTVERVGEVLHMLAEVEIDCKSTGVPDRASCGRALLRLAAMAARAAGPRRR